MATIRERTTYQERQIRLRLEILDELLGSNARRTYTELLNKLNETLDLKGEKHISIRTLKYDIDHLENQQAAPIHRPTKKEPHIYYSEKFSLKDVGLSDEEVEYLRSAIEILKQVYNFQILEDVEDVIQKLENRVNISKDEKVRTLIHFEKQGLTVGQDHFDNLLSAIKGKNVIRIDYQPYAYPEPKELIVHPYLLKEFRNRWFIFGRVENQNKPTVFALDRIKKIKNANIHFLTNDIFDPDTYFNHLIGVSIPLDSVPTEIKIKVNKQQIPYLQTKPIHDSQTILKSYKDGSVLIGLLLTINYELKSTLLSYGSGIEVIHPIELREQFKELLSSTLSFYQ